MNELIKKWKYQYTILIDCHCLTFQCRFCSERLQYTNAAKTATMDRELKDHKCATRAAA